MPTFPLDGSNMQTGGTRLPRVAAGGLSMTNPGAPTLSPMDALGAPAPASTPSGPAAALGGMAARPTAPAPTSAFHPRATPTPGLITDLKPTSSGFASNLPVPDWVTQQQRSPILATPPSAQTHDISTPEGRTSLEDAINQHIQNHAPTIPHLAAQPAFKLGNNGQSPAEHVAAIHNGALDFINQAHAILPQLDQHSEAAAQNAQRAINAGNFAEAIRQHALMTSLHNSIGNLANMHRFALGTLAHTNSALR